MAVLNQFQQYSQSENTITNNVLLMLSNLYEINPRYYEEFIKGLTEDTQYEVIPSFLQQVSNKGGGIIDGHIQVKASKIIIETKIHALEWIDKLVKYSKSFEDNEYKLLIHLSTDKYSSVQIEEINNKLRENDFSGKINFYSITYQDLVDQLKAVANDHTYEHYLQRLSEHFKDYCLNMGLMPISSHILRAMACGQSFDLNVKHRFYFDLAHKGYSKFNYLGIYNWKSVRYIGIVENTIVADWNEENGLNVIDSDHEVTEEQSQRLTKAIIDSRDNGWDINEGLRFFLLKELKETDFIKTTPGGIFRVRYFNLEDYINPIPESLTEIAEQLKGKSWKEDNLSV